MHTKTEDHGRIAVRLVPLRRACLGLAAALFPLAAFTAMAQQSNTIDLAGGWRFQPDTNNQGETAGWAGLTFDDAAWPILAAGKRWEEQGYPNLDGYAWYRHGLDVPESWRGARVWLYLGGVNDSCVIYCNGKRVQSFGDRSEYSVNATPLVVDLSDSLRFGERNVVVVQVLDWGGSGGLWRAPCLLTRDAAALPPTPEVAWYTEDEGKNLTVEIDCRSLGNDRPGATAQVALAPKDGASAPAQRLDVSEKEKQATAHFALPPAKSGAVYNLSVNVTTSDGKPLGGPGTPIRIALPEPAAWPVKYGALHILNNFVTELAHVNAWPALSKIDFANPRSGWVFLAVDAPASGPAPRLFLDSETEPLVWRPNPAAHALEAMRQLAEGPHTVRAEGLTTGYVDIRAVPELAYCYYLANPHIAAQGPYDKPYLDKHVLSHVNTLVAGGPPPSDDLAQWRREGRQWLANAALPGLSATTPPAVEDVYKEWAANPGTSQPGYGGLIVDEFITAGADHYRAWTQAVNRLTADSRFAGRTFYAWCGELYQTPQGLDFARALLKHDERFVWEVYLSEEKTEQAARQSIRRSLQHSLRVWEQAAPHTLDHMVLCLGYMSAPPESLDTNPAVDYNVFMDMQMHLLATEPEFWKLYGLMQYSASYADEEAVRWAHRMFRHYCIEGRRDRLIPTPYELPHLQNPDFAQGTEHWRVDAAADGSVAVQQKADFSWLQGRYPKTLQGDQYLCFKRSESKPNRVSQTLSGLRPGQIYSVKLLSADMRHMDVKSTLGLQIDIDGAEPIKDLSFQYVYPSNYAHESPPYTKDHPAWINYHRIVFRATGATAELSISDWAHDAPGGPAGQEIGFNFVEAQPYLLP